MENSNILKLNRFLAILVMGSYLLPVIFINLPYPMSSTVPYFSLWVISMMLFCPKVLGWRYLSGVYIFVILYLLLMFFGVFEIELSWLFREIMMVFLAIIIYRYFLETNDLKGLNIFLKTTLVFIGVTIITTSLGLQKYPLAARGLAGGAFSEMHFYHRRLGIASYGFFYGCAFLLPSLIAILKNPQIFAKEKIFSLSLIVLILFGITQTQFVTAFIFALMGLIISLTSKGEVKPAFIMLGFIILLTILIPRGFLADRVLEVANMVQSDYLQQRLTDISFSIRLGFSNLGAHGTYVDTRYSFIPPLLHDFAKSPFIGGGSSGGHNWWLDRLAMFGLLGVLPWSYIFYLEIKRNLKTINQYQRAYYLVFMILFILVGFIKNLVGLMFLFTFCIAPALLVINNEYGFMNEENSSNN